jgi:hypothetical protein
MAYRVGRAALASRTFSESRRNVHAELQKVIGGWVLNDLILWIPRWSTELLVRPGRADRAAGYGRRIL